MTDRPRVFRLSCKAIIVEDGQLLVIHLRDGEDDFYTLPGGGQELGESIAETLERECREEIGCGVVRHEIMFARDYFGWHHEFAHVEGHVHQVELMFRCEIRPGERPTHTSVPDLMQVGFTWLPLDELESRWFYPKAMRRPLLEALAAPSPPPGQYLGAIN